MFNTPPTTEPSTSPTTPLDPVALRRAANAAYERMLAARKAAEREWAARRAEIKKESPPPNPEEVRLAQRKVKEAQLEERDAIKQAERERDLVIQKARADCEKKKAQIQAETRKVRDAAENADRAHKRRVAEHEKDLRAKYAYERPAYFADVVPLQDEYEELREQAARAVEHLSPDERYRIQKEADTP